MFYGNGKPNYYLFTDNQAAEHIATQPNMNDHSHSIDIRHHAIRQDYVNGEMRIGGVATHDNTSDILTKNLQPPIHTKHTRELHITHERPTLSNNVVQCLPTNFTKTIRTRKPPRFRPNPLRKIIPRTPPTPMPTLHKPHRKWDFDPKTHRKPPEPFEFKPQTHHGSTRAPR